MSTKVAAYERESVLVALAKLLRTENHWQQSSDSRHGSQNSDGNHACLQYHFAWKRFPVYSSNPVFGSRSHGATILVNEIERGRDPRREVMQLINIHEDSGNFSKSDFNFEHTQMGNGE